MDIDGQQSKRQWIVELPNADYDVRAVVASLNIDPDQIELISRACRFIGEHDRSDALNILVHLTGYAGLGHDALQVT